MCASVFPSPSIIMLTLVKISVVDETKTHRQSAPAVQPKLNQFQYDEGVVHLSELSIGRDRVRICLGGKSFDILSVSEGLR